MFKKDNMITADEFNSIVDVFENTLGIDMNDSSKSNKVLKNSITKTFGEGGDFSSFKDIENFINDNVFDQNTYLNVIFKPGTYHETITNGTLLNIEGSFLTFKKSGTGDVNIIIDSADVSDFTAILIQSRSVFVTKNITFIDATGSNESTMIMCDKDSVATALNTTIKTGGIGIYVSNFSKLYTMRYTHDSLDISGGTAILIRYKSEFISYFNIDVNKDKQYVNKMSSAIEAQISSSITLFNFISSSVSINNFFAINHDSRCYVNNASDLNIVVDNTLYITRNSEFYSNKIISGINNYNTVLEDGSRILTEDSNTISNDSTFIKFNNAIDILRNGIIRSVNDLDVSTIDSYGNNTYITTKYLEEKRPIKRRIVDVYNGDDLTTNYELRYALVENTEVDVYVNGVLRLEDDILADGYRFYIDKTSGLAAVSFNSAPISTDKIVIKYWYI